MKEKHDDLVYAIGRLLTWSSLVAMIWLLLLGVLQPTTYFWVFFGFFFLSSLKVPEKGV